MPGTMNICWQNLLFIMEKKKAMVGTQPKEQASIYQNKEAKS